MRKSGWISGLALVVVLFFLMPFGALGQTWGPKYVSMTWGTGGYYEYLPVGYSDPGNAGKKYPVILFLHGIGEQGNGTSDLSRVRTVGFPTVINSGNFPNSFTVGGQNFSFIAIVPQFSGWPGSSQVEDILNFIQANYRADESRLYLTGLSMGGGATWDYASSSPAAASRLAAILPVCGAASPSSVKNQIMANAGLPVLATHNNLDPIVSVYNTIGFVDGMNSNGVNPSAIKVIWNSAIHNAWSQSYDPYEKLTGNLNAYEWLLQYSRGSATPPPPPSLSASIASNIAVSCNGLSNGSATVTASGGAAPYSYSWSTSPVQTGATASNLAAGSYTVTIRDGNNATANATVTIGQPAKLSLTVTPGTIATHGGTTSVALIASGGTAPYSYSGPVSGVAAGTYTYTVTDAKGCQDTKTVTITQPAPTPITASLYTWKEVSCNGGSDGSATLEVKGGVAPYTYSWSTTPVQTTLTASNLSAGTYTFTVRDAQNTSTTVAVNVEQPAKLNLNVSPGTIPVAGGTTNVSLSAMGGTAPYTFTGSVTNLGAGTYTYIVTDARGCTETKTVTLTEPAPVVPPPAALSISVSASNDVSCYGGSNGNASVTATGGLAPYTYSWSTVPVQTSATAANLTAGVYTATVRDANGEVRTLNVTIAQPAPLNVTVSPGTIPVFGGTTNVGVSASGGTAPYTYSGPVTNVWAGIYTYTVTDAKGCTDSETITIKEPTPVPPLVLTTSHVNATCYGQSNGTAGVSVTGGVPPYGYSWNSDPAQNTASASGLKAGNYVVTVRDAANTTATATLVIAEPSPLILGVTPGSINVNGGKTSVTLAATGGTAPYTYSGPTTNVSAGTYTYTVTDAAGCTDSRVITVAEPPASVPVSAVVNAWTHVSCSGGSDGTATLAIKEGSSPYSIRWNTTPVQTTATAVNLKAGTYTATVQDANNTTAVVSVTINEPMPLSLAVTTGSISVAGGTTQVNLVATGGTAPYTYSGVTTNVAAGTYNYTVTDSKGCSKTESVTITEPSPAPPAVSVVSFTNAKCAGSADGSATVAVSGGKAPYSFQWSNLPTQITASATGLASGSYTVIVTDANGQKGTTTVLIEEPTALTLEATTGVISAAGGTTTVNLSATGGTAPYTYIGPTNNVAAGSYTYTVTDINGCSASRSINITAVIPPAPPAAAGLSAKATVKPVNCFGGNDGAAVVEVTGGRSPYTISWSGVSTASGPSVSGLSAGNYTVIVTDADKAVFTLQIEIAQPTLLTLQATANDIQTFGGITQVTLQASGGTAPYAFTGGTSNVKAGTYTYQVTDANGCSTSKSLVIRQVTPLIMQVTPGNITCYDGTTQVTLRYGGGLAPYTVTGDTLQVKAGVHVYTVTDAAGTRATQTIEIQQPEKLELIATSGLIRNIGGTTIVELSAKGGTTPYSYLGEISNVKAGNYTYNVLDANACKATASVEVREPSVKLSSFDALKSDTSVDLKWATSYEYAIDHFDIERSEDNQTFTVVSRVTSLWNSLRTARYVISDIRPFLKRNYYRIVAVTSYGERIVLDQKDLFYNAKGKFTVKNMPSMLDITVENNFIEPLTLILYDMNGKPLKMKTFTKQTYLWNTKFDLQGLPSGSYIISAQSLNYKHVKQIIKL
jgi:dienelactone hydrolase